MGLESRLRDLVVRTPLAESRAIGAGYAVLNRVRYGRSWERPVSFRGARFVIGRDLGLYPFVRAGGFEVRELDWLLPRITSTDRVWDVGANVGLYSVLTAQRAAGVVAFEPVPSTVKRLQANLALNEITNVQVVNAALGDAPGQVEMAMDTNGAGGNHLVRAGAGGVAVAVTTGDLVASESGLPDIMKVDVEGFEPEVVQGAWETLRARRPLLMLEVNATTMLDEAERARWQSMVDNLFVLYGGALWFGPSGPPVQVTGLGPADVPQRPCTLAFTS
jgi:FkbM family methyltransferase